MCVRCGRLWTAAYDAADERVLAGSIIVCGGAVEVDRLRVIAAAILAQIVKRVCSGYKGVVGVRQAIGAAVNGEGARPTRGDEAEVGLGDNAADRHKQIRT